MTQQEMMNYRADFPLLRESKVAYLDNAATSQRPDCVLDAQRKFYETHNANPLRGLYQLGMDATEDYAAARETVRRFLNAKSDSEIIFTRNATESLNLVAYSYGLHRIGPEDEIVVSIAEHHSNMLPWRMVARQTGATLRYLECTPDGSLPMAELKAKITDKTALVAVAQVSNVFGRTNPMDTIIDLAHKHGAVVVMDAAQSAPHIPIDVQALGVDFVAFSGHKLMGPMGIGVLYGKEELLEEMPPFLSGGEMIEYVTRDKVTYAPLPHKFEAGTVNAAGAVGLAAAIDYLTAIGWDKLHAQEVALTDFALQGLRAMPYVHVIGAEKAEEHCGILTFTVDGVHPHDISAILDAADVAIRAGHHCAQPLMQHLGTPSTARASLFFYNTEEEVQRFLDAVASLRRQMGYGE